VNIYCTFVLVPFPIPAALAQHVVRVTPSNVQWGSWFPQVLS